MKKKTLIKTALAAGAVTAGAGYLLFEEVMDRNAKLYPLITEYASKKLGWDAEEDLDERDIWFDQQEFTEYEMINPKNFRLKAYCLPAENPSNVYVFCSHGYKSSGKAEYRRMTKFYHDMGYNVFIIDHQAHGESDGKYIGFGLHESRDGLLWLDWMIEKFGSDIQIILEGISMGCATVTMMTGDPSLPSNVKFTVADCGYTSAQAQFEYCMNELMHLPKFPLINTSDVFNKLINGYSFKDANPIECIKDAKIPMLFIHGAADDFVPTYMVYELYDACGSEYKDLLLVDGAGHAESYKTNSEAYEAKVKEFAEKFIK